MAITLRSTISWTAAAFAPALLLSASLMAVAQITENTDEHYRLRGDAESRGPARATDPLADFLSPTPMGLPQRFAVTPRVSRADPPAQPPAPARRFSHEMRNSRIQAQAERPGFKHKGTQTVSARPLRLDAGRNQASGVESALSFAPVERRRTGLSQRCLPPFAFEQNGLPRCNTGMPSYRGRFEELLGQ
jgi:hypothetical protein